MITEQQIVDHLNYVFSIYFEEIDYKYEAAVVELTKECRVHLNCESRFGIQIKYVPTKFNKDNKLGVCVTSPLDNFPLKKGYNEAIGSLEAGVIRHMLSELRNKIKCELKPSQGG